MSMEWMNPAFAALRCFACEASALEARGAIAADERVVLFNTGTGLKYR